jgi:hypothetical protein
VKKKTIRNRTHAKEEKKSDQRSRWHTISEIKQALKKSGGLVYFAADQLKMTPGSLYDRIRNSVELKAHLKEVRGRKIDFAESSLHRAVLDGKGWAVRMALLNTVEGRDRGYAERHEVSGAGGGPIETHEVRQIRIIKPTKHVSEKKE